MSSSLCLCTCCAWEKEGAMVGTRIFLPASASWPCRPAPHRNTSHFPPRCQSWSWTQTWKMEEKNRVETRCNIKSWGKDLVFNFWDQEMCLLCGNIHLLTWPDIPLTYHHPSVKLTVVNVVILVNWDTFYTILPKNAEQIFCDCLTVSQWPLALFLQSEVLLADEPEVSISTSYVALLSSYQNFRKVDLWPWSWGRLHWNSNSSKIFSRHLWFQFQTPTLLHYFHVASLPARQRDSSTASAFYAEG